MAPLVVLTLSSNALQLRNCSHLELFAISNSLHTPVAVAPWVSHYSAGADPMDIHPSPDYRAQQFPSHNEPRVWLITAGDSPIGISVARQVLGHGDYVLLGLAHSVLERDQRRRDGFDAFLAEVEEHSDDGWKQRMKAVPLDIRCV